MMLTTSPSTLGIGESLEITFDARYSIPSIRQHGRMMMFGVQTNGVDASGGQAETVSGFLNFFGAELSREAGQLRYNADSASWWVNDGTHIETSATNVSMNPFGYDFVTMTDIGLVDSDSDVVRTTYLITKSHVTNEFDVSVTISDSITGFSETYAEAGISRPGAWAGNELYFFLDTNPEAGRDYGIFVQTAKMDRLDPVPVPPASVSALGLDGSVSLTWTEMAGAATYDIYRSTTSGGSFTLLASDETQPYSDTSVANGTTYYYTVVSKFTNGDSAQSGEAQATPKAIFDNVTVYDNDFSSYSLGDLTVVSTDWDEVSGSGSNAFAVINDNGTNKADTVATQADHDSVEGNAVYLDKLLRNDADDIIEGHIDLVFSVTANSGTDAVYTHKNVFTFGPTTSTADSLKVTGKDNMALLNAKMRYENRLLIMFGDDSITEANALAIVNFNELGWNPKPNSGQSWVGTPGTADLETDPLRISYKFRKTREDGVYQVWASVSNMNTMITYSESENEFRTLERQDLYDSPATLFGMSHDYQAKVDSEVDIIDVTVNEMSVTHSTQEPAVVVPQVTSVLSGDRQVSITWEPILEASGGYTLTVVTPDSEEYVVAENTTETTITDSPRWNDIANTYTLTANFDSELTPNTASTNFVAAPVGLVSAFEVDSFGTANMDTALLQISNAVDWATIDAMTTPFFENGENSYTGPTLYGMYKGKQAVDGVLLQTRVQDAGGKVNFTLDKGWKSWPYASVLAFVEASDMGTATFDATAETLNVQVSWGATTTGNAGNQDNGLRLAIRNGSTWYASDENIVASDATKNDPKTIIVADVASADWRPITGINAAATSEMWIGGVVDGSTFTDVNAVGWFQARGWVSSIYGLEVKVQGALPSYEYWTENSGLVSSNNAATADPDLDGLVNEKEYAFGGNPLVADTATLPVMDPAVVDISGTDYLTYVYQKRRDPVSGISYALKTTTDLVNVPFAANGAVLTDEQVIDYYWTAVTNYVPFTADKTFIKVDVE